MVCVTAWSHAPIRTPFREEGMNYDGPFSFLQPSKFDRPTLQPNA